MASTPHNGSRAPFTLPSHIVYFHDWRYVDHGYLRWLGPNDQPVPLMPAPDPLPAIHSSDEWLPRGVRIETVPGKVDEAPCLTAKALNEILFFGGSVVRDGGTYRLFYESCHPDSLAPSKIRMLGHHKRLRYAESDDAVSWRFPACGSDGNVVFDPGPVGYHGGCVFIDSAGPASERYKSIWLGMASAEALNRYQERWPNHLDPMCIHNAELAAAKGCAALAVFGAVSPDGFRWRLIAEPLLIQHSDTFNACAYDAALRQYVAYLRGWYLQRRCVMRAAGDDFRHLGPAEPAQVSDPGMLPTDTWYTPGYTRMPDAPDYQLMFATLWTQTNDTFTPILHASADGIVWSRVPGAPAMAHGPRGSWYHCGAAVTSLVALPNDEVGSLVMGWHVAHKYPRSMPGFGQAGWVRWQRGRVTALRADAAGYVPLYPLRFKGRKMILNHRTRADGSITVSVQGANVYREFKDCDIIRGDELDRVVTWRGESDLRHGGDEPVQISLRLVNADLFSVRFE